MALPACPEHLRCAGNVDPGLLFGTPSDPGRVVDTVAAKARGRRHIPNLGHGILPGTPEERMPGVSFGSRQKR